jgi:hypothetical protein
MRLAAIRIRDRNAHRRNCAARRKRFRAAACKQRDGTERVVCWLTDELVGLGDKVAMNNIEFVGAVGHAFEQRGERRHRIDRRPAQPWRLGTDGNELGLNWIHIPLLRWLGRPFVTTLHGGLIFNI